MKKQFVLPFRLGKQQLRAVLDANGHEVVVFPKGCEYLASDYVQNVNDSLYSYKNGQTAGEIAQKVGYPVGKIGCPNCGIVSIGAIDSVCSMCSKILIETNK